MRSRTLALLIAVLLTVSVCFSACSGSRGPKVGICFSSFSQPYQQDALLSALEEAGYRCVIKEAHGDQALQSQQLNELLDDRCALILIEPVLSDSAQELADALRQAGKPGIFIGKEPASSVLESYEKLCYVGWDALQPGYVQAQILSQIANRGDLNGDGAISYAFLSGPQDDSVAQIHIQAVKAQLALSGKELTELAAIYTDGVQESGREQCAKLMNRFGKDLEVLFCTDQFLSDGAARAVSEGGRAAGEDLILLGVGGDQSILLLLEQQMLTGTVTADKSLYTHLAQTIQDLLDGKEVSPVYYGEFISITVRNLLDFL